jgi:hypothetical protein
MNGHGFHPDGSEETVGRETALLWSDDPEVWRP